LINQISALNTFSNSLAALALALAGLPKNFTFRASSCSYCAIVYDHAHYYSTNTLFVHSDMDLRRLYLKKKILIPICRLNML
jgi:hypothetical protein